MWCFLVRIAIRKLFLLYANFVFLFISHSHVGELSYSFYVSDAECRFSVFLLHSIFVFQSFFRSYLLFFLCLLCSPYYLPAVADKSSRLTPTRFDGTSRVQVRSMSVHSAVFSQASLQQTAFVYRTKNDRRNVSSFGR